ncbi:MAG: hypothetical protein GY953_19845, partial [bacterium]|nr:hypothetical protein [bacterium]
MAADREGRPREILSPLIARNSHATFLCTVTAPQGMIFYAYFSQYPDVMEMTLYKAMFSEHDGAWIPDRLLEITSPYTSHVPDRYHGISNQTAEVFVIDLWAPRTAEPGRMKVDIQLGVAGNWITYPMEVRISDEIAPDVL